MGRHKVLRVKDWLLQKRLGQFVVLGRVNDRILHVRRVKDKLDFFNSMSAPINIGGTGFIYYIDKFMEDNIHVTLKEFPNREFQINLLTPIDFSLLAKEVRRRKC